MAAMPEEKAGIASGVLQTARLMGIVVGLAVMGALFRGVENERVADEFASQGTDLDSAEKADVRGVLSGSESARENLESLTGEMRDVVDDIVDVAFTAGLRWVMVVSAVVAALGIWPALWGRREAAEAREESPATAQDA